MAAGSLAIFVKEMKDTLALCDQLTGKAGGSLDQYMQHIDELDRIIQPTAQRTQMLTEAHEAIQNARDKADLSLKHLDTCRKVEARIRLGPRPNLDAFVAALARLEVSIAFFQQNRAMQTTNEALRTATGLRQEALQACVRDFSAVLQEHCSPPSTAALTQQAFVDVESPGLSPEAVSIGSGADILMIPDSAVNRLRTLGAAMLRNGETACFKVYVESRRAVMERTLQNLGNEFVPRDDYARLSWPMLEKKIQGWILALRVMMRMVVAESQLADRVFTVPYDEAAFTDVVKKSVNSMAQFGEGIVNGRRAPEKVFGLMDMFENLESCQPVLADMLDGVKGGALLAEYSSLSLSMQREARATFSDFESSILRDSSKHIVADGTVHPLAAYTLGYLKRMFAYDSSIPILFGDPADPPAIRLGEVGSAQSLLPDRMRMSIQRILDTLITNLDAKSTSYKSKALAALFTMNNIHHMVKTVESSATLMLLGQEWLEHCKDKVEEWGEAYQALCWGALVELINADLQPRARPDKASAKDRCKAVSAALTAISESQSAWTVPDAMLRLNLKDAIVQDFLPPYTAYVDRGGGLPAHSAQKYIKFSVADVRNLIQNDLFETKDDLSSGANRSGTSTRSISQKGV